MTSTGTHLHASLLLAAGTIASAAARRLPTEHLLVPGPSVGPDTAPAPADPRVLRAALIGEIDGRIHLIIGAEVLAALDLDGTVASLAVRDAASSIEAALGVAVEAGPVEAVDSVDADETTIAVPMFDADRLVATFLLTVASPVETGHGLAGAALPAVSAARDLGLLHQVEMGVTVELGRTRLTIRELLGLAPGSVVELDRTAGAPVDVLVNGTLIARGEVVVVDEEFAVRISEIVAGDNAVVV